VYPYIEVLVFLARVLAISPTNEHITLIHHQSLHFIGPDLDEDPSVFLQSNNDEE
jgi:hypothetical protein